MNRSILIMVSDNAEQIENTKKHYQNSTDVTFQAYSPYQWKEGLDNPFFRQQLSNGVPSLVSGLSSVGGEEGQVLPFPGPTSSSFDTAHVQKMDQIEAKAIENAILQYKGNLTEAAKALGIGRATLYRKVKQYHIDPTIARKKKLAAA